MAAWRDGSWADCLAARWDVVMAVQMGVMRAAQRDCLTAVRTDDSKAVLKVYQMAVAMDDQMVGP